MIKSSFLILAILSCSNAFSFEFTEKGNQIAQTMESQKDLLSIREKLHYPESLEQIAIRKGQSEINKNSSILKEVALIKYDLINGNTEKAKARILKAQYKENYSSIIQKRYLAIIYFIDGNYKKSLEILENKEFSLTQNIKHVCMLKTLNLIILNRKKEVSEVWDVCLKNTIGLSNNFHIWMNSLVELFTKKSSITKLYAFKNLNIENEKGELLRILLKLSLYLNQQKNVLKRTPNLSNEIFNNKYLREIIGLLYFRDLDLIKSYQYIEDLQTPNSENLKGNLYLAKNKYELAYAQFKLALNKKSNSQNALERITPTSWILKEWKDGYSFIKKLNVDKTQLFKKLIIKAAFEIQLNKFKEAQQTLNIIINNSDNAFSLEVAQIYSYINFKKNEVSEDRKYANRSCEQLDGLNCWLLYQFSIWENLSITAKREEKISEKDKFNLDKLTSLPIENPIEEESIISQKDIEEMDNSLISLISTEK